MKKNIWLKMKLDFKIITIKIEVKNGNPLKIFKKKQI